MQHKSILSLALALLLTLALALPALADGTGCPIEISSRLTDATLDRSQGLTYTIVPQSLRDKYRFVGHTGSTKRAEAPAPAADRSFQSALAALGAFMSGFGMPQDIVDEWLSGLAGAADLLGGEEVQAAAIFSLIESQPNANGYYIGSSPFPGDHSDCVYVFDSINGILDVIRPQ